MKYIYETKNLVIGITISIVILLLHITATIASSVLVYKSLSSMFSIKGDINIIQAIIHIVMFSMCIYGWGTYKVKIKTKNL